MGYFSMNTNELDFSYYLDGLKGLQPIRVYGLVSQVIGMAMEGRGPNVPLGAICSVELRGGNSVLAEVVGFKDSRVLLMPLGDMKGVEPGGRIWVERMQADVPVGEAMRGRILNGLGQAIDAKGPIRFETAYPLYAEPLNPIDRPRIDSVMDAGVRAINACLTLGKGQRIAIMAGSGVGKSTLLGMIARHTTADINVIALIGERGRELNDFIQRDLGPEGLARSVVVVATSDTPPLIRLRGAYVATAIAEFFRDKGLNVVLMMDSVTRFAMAQRDVGLAIGEPPTSRGYTPSVFSLLPKLLERAGTKRNAGTITGIYTVLVEGDDMNEPIADTVRSIVDGHVVLSRAIAQQGHYPAIDVLASVSRLMRDIVGREQIEDYQKLIKVLATYKKVEDLVNLGAYTKGSNADIDFALNKINAVNAFLRQEMEEACSYERSCQELAALFR